MAVTGWPQLSTQNEKLEKQFWYVTSQTNKSYHRNMETIWKKTEIRDLAFQAWSVIWGGHGWWFIQDPVSPFSLKSFDYFSIKKCIYSLLNGCNDLAILPSVVENSASFTPLWIKVLNGILWILMLWLFVLDSPIIGNILPVSGQMRTSRIYGLLWDLLTFL